ncbi:hypothetical protein ABIF63_005794 [Bradyrhizobium japonicum]|uniref:Uncharacterized protein n=1 Tax=Bradyrhizobium japonicum TaxID=375 RepID=A0ABV2RXM1_BRAJP
MSEQAIEALQREMRRLAAENLAQQFVLTCFFQRIGQAIPGSKITILQAFDDAANHAEQFSIASGREAGHLPETLRIIEQMRLMLVGEDKPRREV